MTDRSEHRKEAEAQIARLIAIVQQQPDGAGKDAMLVECQALTRATVAFHMEGIRFRTFNVDRLLARESLPLPAEAAETFAAARKALEQAGFHTRSHQSPV
ncbi:hypothetical protein BH18ACI5_BH18ACI5_30590 [soil metagenome]